MRKAQSFSVHFLQITDFCWLGLRFAACSILGANAGRTKSVCGIKDETITTFSIVFLNRVCGMVLGVVRCARCEAGIQRCDGCARPSSGGWRRGNRLVHDLGERPRGSKSLKPANIFHVGCNDLFGHLGRILTGLHQNAEQFVREERLHCRITRLCLHSNRNVRKQRLRSDGARATERRLCKYFILHL